MRCATPPYPLNQWYIFYRHAESRSLTHILTHCISLSNQLHAFIFGRWKPLLVCVHVGWTPTGVLRSGSKLLLHIQQVFVKPVSLPRLAKPGLRPLVSHV